MVGVTGFEPATSSSRTKRASQAALYPDAREKREETGTYARRRAEVNGALTGDSMRRNQRGVEAQRKLLPLISSAWAPPDCGEQSLGLGVIRLHSAGLLQMPLLASRHC
jgi:hypothetical protein